MSRLTADNELTALRASGVSLSHVARPLLLASCVVAALAFLFSDQVLPRSNHRLRTLLTDITRTKPTFAIEEQVINEVQRSRMFLRAGSVDQSTFTLRDVTIFDLTDHNRKRVTYADSAHMAFDENREDLYLTLFDGTMHESDRSNPQNFQVADFRQDRVFVEGVGGNFTRTLDDRFKGDREMGVCEMDSIVRVARHEIWTSLRRAEGVELNSLRGLVGLAAVPFDTIGPSSAPPRYCRALGRIQEWVQRTPLSQALPPDVADPTRPAVTPPSAGGTFPSAARVTPGNARPRIGTAKVLADRATSAQRRAAGYLVEVHKKYAIAAACVVFVLIGIPAAIRFPRAGVGLVVGLSLVVFTIYYVGLIGGETVANRLIVSPVWAMWTPNLIFAVVGTVTIWLIRRQTTSSRRRGRVKEFRRRATSADRPLS